MADRLPFEALAARLPRPWASPLGAAIGSLRWWAGRTGRRRVERRLAAALPSLPAPRRRWLGGAAARRRGGLRFLSSRLLALDDVGFCRALEIRGWHSFHAARDAGGVVIVATAPLGSPAIVARALAIYRPGTPLLTAAAGEGPALLAGNGLLSALDGRGRVRLVAAFALAAGAGFRLEVLPAIGIDPGSERATRALAHWVAAAEAVIRRHPDQFDWGAPR